MLLGMVALLCSETVQSSRWWWWIVAGSGAVAALHALLRLNVGVLIVLLAVLGAAPAIPRMPASTR